MRAVNSQVLVLNRLWQPVHICCARRAFSLLFLEHAEVVHTDAGSNFYTHDIESWMLLSKNAGEKELVRTVSHQFLVPAIIVLKVFDRLPKQDIKFTRQNVFERDRYTCQYCSTRFEAKELNIDHVIPRDKGGKSSWENVVCSCIKCNSRKANHLPSQVNMFPIREPRAPKWRPLFGTGPNRPARMAHESWRHFIDPSPSQVLVSG